MSEDIDDILETRRSDSAKLSDSDGGSPYGEELPIEASRINTFLKCVNIGVLLTIVLFVLSLSTLDSRRSSVNPLGVIYIVSLVFTYISSIGLAHVSAGVGRAVVYFLLLPFSAAIPGLGFLLFPLVLVSLISTARKRLKEFGLELGVFGVKR